MVILRQTKCAYTTDITGGNEKCFYIIRNSQQVNYTTQEIKNVTGLISNLLK